MPPNIVVTDIPGGVLELDSGSFMDGTLTMAAAKTLPKGTILARDAATSKFVVFAIGGAGGAGVPVAVLTYALVTIIGDQPVRALIAGRVNRMALIIDADGTNVNVNALVVDGLKDSSIVALDTTKI